MFLSLYLFFLFFINGFGFRRNRKMPCCQCIIFWLQLWPSILISKSLVSNFLSSFSFPSFHFLRFLAFPCFSFRFFLSSPNLHLLPLLHINSNGNKFVLLFTHLSRFSPPICSSMHLFKIYFSTIIIIVYKILIKIKSRHAALNYYKI